LANTKSAQKAMRQSVRRADRNKGARSTVRTFTKKATEAVLVAADDAAEIVRQAVSALDTAAHKGIVHRNAAARRKSRLMARLHQLSLAASGEYGTVETAEVAGKAAPKAGAKRTTAGAKATAEKRGAAAKKPAGGARKPSARKS
jgi:small subunit ribosomal protein S20